MQNNIHKISILNENTQTKVEYNVGDVIEMIYNTNSNEFISDNKNNIKYVYITHRPSFLVSIIKESKLNDINIQLEMTSDIKARSIETESIDVIFKDEYDFLKNKYVSFEKELTPKYANNLSNLFATVNRELSFIKNQNINYNSRDKANIESTFDQLHVNVKDDLTSLLKATVNEQITTSDDYSKSVDILTAINAESFARLGLDVKRGLLKLKSEAEKNGIETEKTLDVKIKTLASKISNFKKTEHSDVVDIIGETNALIELIEKYKPYLTEQSFNEYRELVMEIGVTKYKILENLQDQTDETKDDGTENITDDNKDDTTTKSDVKDIKKYIVSEEFEYSNVVALPLGELVTLNTNSLKSKNITSFISKFTKAMDDVFGYEPTAEIASVISKYEGLRAFNGHLAKYTLEQMGKAGWLVGKKEDGRKLGSNIGKWATTEMLQKPGEINPQIVKLEQKLRNPINSISNVFRNEDTKKEDKYKIVDDKKTNENLSVSLGDSAMNTSNVGNGFFNEPGMTGSMGNPIPPTQTEKGSGDKFTSNNNKFKNKKKKDQHINRTKNMYVPQFKMFVEKFNK